MRRRYDTELYTNRVSHIKSVMPHACIGVDVITGFNGETEDDFLDTYNFVNELDVSYLHVFTYSERENTPGPDMEFTIPYGERKKRSKMLRILSEKKKRAFYDSQLNSDQKVLFEKVEDNGLVEGWTENYVRVVSNNKYSNEIISMKLKAINDKTIVEGELLELV